MQVFSPHRKKLEPYRRFGTRAFQNKIREAANYKRALNIKLDKFQFNFGLWKYLFGLVILVFVYYLFFSPRFTVRTVEVSGNSQVAAQDISDALTSRHPRFFFLSGGRADRILTAAIPTIKRISSYRRIWPDKVRITVEERIPGFVIESNNQKFLIDDEGTVVSQVSDTKNFLIVHDQLTENFATGELLPNAKMAAFVVSMQKQWPSKISAPLASVKFPGKASTDAEFVTQAGWSALFDTSRSVVVELEDLDVLLRKQIKDPAKLAYIDLRLSDWAYYCYKQTACSQVAQPQQKGTNGQ